MIKYHCAKLSKIDLGVVRSSGPGLGNLLFPILRAVIAARRQSELFVYPTFPQVKIGPIVRREKDKRFYFNEFRSRNFLDWKFFLLALSSKNKVVHEGLGKYFYDLKLNRRLVREWIEGNCLYRNSVESEYDIAVHVRLGDFSSENHKTGASVRLPPDWYERAYCYAKKISCKEDPVVRVYSDSSRLEVAQYLNIENFELDESENAISAILNMSKAKVVICSNSTFSMWSVFLGDSEAIWNDEFNLGAYFPIDIGVNHFIK